MDGFLFSEMVICCFSIDFFYSTFKIGKVRIAHSCIFSVITKVINEHYFARVVVVTERPVVGPYSKVVRQKL